METRMSAKRPAPHAVTLLLALAGALSLAGCDDRQQRSGPKTEEISAESRAPHADAARRGPAMSPQQQAEAQPGSGPEMPRAAANMVIGTWRVRVPANAAEVAGVVYTFTADGRVTVGPKHICRYRLDRDVLSIDCVGAAADAAMGESATGKVAPEDANTLVWTVGDRTVRLERQSGVKEQQ